MTEQDPFIGRSILDGEFQILEKIGSGGMGSVYKALQPEMNRMVAVKFLHPKLTMRKDVAARFRREARALSHLTHPNTVRVLLYGELEDGSLYIVMEFLEGRNLNQVAKREGPVSVERALPIMIQASCALEEAHKAGIIHRDLKPENIFVCQQGGMKDFVKVLDFGLAKVTEREMRPGSVILTQEGVVFGTPEFMSPEQAQALPLSPASDVYALAVILYEVLTGKLPFDANTSADYLKMHVSAPPIYLNERVPKLVFPQALEDAIDKALSKDPAERFPTAGAFGDALEAIVEAAREAKRESLRPSSTGSVAASSDSVVKVPQSIARMPAKGSPQNTLYVGLVVAFAAALAAAILIMKTLG